MPPTPARSHHAQHRNACKFAPVNKARPALPNQGDVFFDCDNCGHCGHRMDKGFACPQSARSDCDNCGQLVP